MFVEFSNGILYNFGYHIGCTIVSEYENSYTTDISSLTAAYDKIHDILSGYYGKSDDTEYGNYGALAESSWENTGYGDVWMIVGENLWADGSGVNEILISSCKQSLAGDYAN